MAKKPHKTHFKQLPSYLIVHKEENKIIRIAFDVGMCSFTHAFHAGTIGTEEVQLLPEGLVVRVLGRPQGPGHELPVVEHTHPGDSLRKIK